MARISNLTNKDPLIEAKANYFVYRFNLFIDHAGDFVDFEVENPLSLTDKIIFQVSSNTHHCWPSVRSYLSHPFYSKEKEYMRGFDGFKEVEEAIEKLLAASNQSKYIISEKDSLVELFTRLRDSLYKKMFKHSLKCLTTIFRCEHPLEEHTKDIADHTKILVSEYFFRNRDKSYLKQAILNILSNDIREFPFPPEITTEQHKIEYMKNRDLVQQFEALFTHLDKNPIDYTYYYRVYGGGFDKGQDFKVNRVHFFSKDHPSLEYLNNEHPEFFSVEGNFIIAKITVNYFSSGFAINEARRLIRQELAFLSVKTNRDFVIDLQEKYIGENKYRSGMAWSSQSIDTVYNLLEMDNMKGNVFDKLRETQSIAKEYIFEHEHIYWKAVHNQEMSGYWHWMEAVLHKYKGVIMEYVAKIVTAHTEHGVRKGLALDELMMAFSFMEYPRDMIGKSVEEAHEAAKSIFNGTIPDWVKELKHPVVQDLIQYYNFEMKSGDYKTASEYYTRVLYDAYAQRNSYVHRGDSDRVAHIKLVYSLHKIVERFRYVLHEKIKSNPSLDFSEVIDSLVNEYKVKTAEPS